MSKRKKPNRTGRKSPPPEGIGDTIDLSVAYTYLEESKTNAVGLFLLGDEEPVASLPVLGELTEARKQSISLAFLDLAMKCLGKASEGQPRFLSDNGKGPLDS